MGCQCGKSTSVTEVQQASSAGAAPGTAKGSKAPALSADVIAKKIQQAKSTRVLALRECGLKSVPPAAAGADHASLRTADLTANALKCLPDSIGSWVGLQNLLCSQNQLAELPSAIGKLVGLQKLVLSENRLIKLPAELSELGKLKIFSLEVNTLGPQLRSPEVFSGALAASLEELDLSQNALQALPTSIGNLVALRRLVLVRNQLKELPEVLGSNTQLSYLDAAENMLQSIPAVLLECTAISELWLKGNPVDRLHLQDTAGFAAFLQRRKQRIDAKIDSHVVGKIDLTVCGLE